MSKVPLSVALLALLSPSSLATGCPPYPPAALPTHDYWAPDGGEGRAVAGRFDDNAVPDVMVLVGGTPHLVRDVETLGYFEAAEGAVNDLALWPGGAPNGRDAVLAVGGEGLLRIHHDDAVGGLVTTVVEGSGVWVDAAFVRVGDVDGDGKLDAVGTNGSTVGVRPNVGSVAATHSWATPKAGDALALVDLAGNGVDAIAIADDAGVTLYDATGDDTPTAFPAATYRELRPVPTPSGAELLSALTTLPSSGCQFVHIGGTTIDSSLLLGDILDFVSVAPVTFVPGAPTDLVGSCRNASELVVFRHTGSSPAYSIHNFASNLLIVTVDGAQQPNGTTSASRAATLVPLDTDGDADDALFVHDAASGVFRVIRNQLIDETAWRPAVTLNGFTLSGATAECVDISWTVSAPTTIEANATSLDWTLYRVPLPDEGPLFPVEVDADSTSTQGGALVTSLVRDPEETVDYIVVVRQVEIAAGDEVAAWSALTFGFTVEPTDGGDPVPVNGPVTRPNGGEEEPPPGGGGTGGSGGGD